MFCLIMSNAVSCSVVEITIIINNGSNFLKFNFENVLGPGLESIIKLFHRCTCSWCCTKNTCTCVCILPSKTVNAHQNRKNKSNCRFKNTNWKPSIDVFQTISQSAFHMATGLQVQYLYCNVHATLDSGWYPWPQIEVRSLYANKQHSKIDHSFEVVFVDEYVLSMCFSLLQDTESVLRW